MSNFATIGIDATPLLGQQSGVGYYTGRLLAALLKHYPEWHYLLYSNRPLGPLEASLQGAIEVKHYFQASRWLWMQATLPKIIWRSQPQLCHFTNALAPLWQPRPFILTIYDASLFLYGAYHPRSRRLTMKTMLPLAAKRASAIITISESSRRDLLQVFPFVANKTHVVYGAAPEQFRPVTDPAGLQAIRHKYQLPDQFLLYVGTIEPRKNLSRLVQALGILHQQGYTCPLLLAGPVGWMMEDFEQEIATLGLKQAIHYLGYVPIEDLPGLYSLATVFAFPSLYEGFGLPPLEAMACGAAVLTSNRSSLAEICDEAALLVNPESPEAIAHGLQLLLDNVELRHEFGRRGIVRAQSFSWQRAAHETATVYRQLLPP